MNDENIIRANEKRTPAERRANAAKAGKASGKARRDKRTFKAIFSEVLDMPIKKGKSTDLDQIRSVADAKGKNLTVQEATALSIAVKALKGDLKAAEFIRDTIGEKPTDAIDIKLPVVIEGEDDFNKLDMSIRGELPDGLFKQITLTFNPWNSTSWLKARFFDAPDENTFVKTTMWECNEWLDEADRHLFEVMRDTNPRRYRVEGLGEWSVTEGLIYSNFEQREFSVNELRKYTTSAFGLDFGYTDPTAFVCCLIDESSREIYIFDELYESGLTNEEIATAIKAMGYGGERIVCDSAEPKSIDELYRLGIKAEPARNRCFTDHIRPRL